MSMDKQVDRRGEIVVCGIPFNTPLEREALRNVKSLGFTSVQLYTFWRDFEREARGQFDWTKLDAKVRRIEEAELKYVPFLLMGPKYAAPDWWLADPGHVGLRCLEHNKDSRVESIWSLAFRAEIRRVLRAFAAHFASWNVLESVQPGICGDYGEAIYPVLGNWPGDYHTHRGFWCGGDDAVASFQDYLTARYRTARRLNAAWRSNYRTLGDVRPFLLHRAPSRTAQHDLIAWYQASMTEYSEFWMAECRRLFPNTATYLCTGGADDDTMTGALFAAQAKVAAKHGGGIRLTNEVNRFDENFRLCAHTSAACRFYGAYLGLEPVGPMTEQGVRNRMFGSVAFGNRQVFHYYGNVCDPKTGTLLPGADSVRSHAALIGEQPVEDGIALFWPVDQGLLAGSMPEGVRSALLHIRREYPVSPVSEEMVLDGALEQRRCLVMIGAESTRREVLVRIAAWVREMGGLLLAAGRCRDIELEPVPEFDALFGITPDSEEGWGHHREDVAAPAEFKRLGEIQRYHSEKGWLGLADGTERLSVAKEGPGGGEGAQESTCTHAVSALFRRRYPSGGQAVFYGGPVSFVRDAQACFADAGAITALLDDVCAASGVQPLGTQPDEIARARVGGRMLVLREHQIEERT
jgi:hypothetical protein